MARLLPELGLNVFYDAPGAELARAVLLPALSVATRYDRVAAYFNLSSMISIGEGLDNLRSNNGRMRLLMGAHDVDQEIVDAALQSELDALIMRLRSRILEGVSTLRSELERDRIEAAAWMMRDGLLEVRCVAPRLSIGSHGIFHNKRLIFEDREGNLVTASGSVNETGAGLGGNFEELTIHTSWDSPSYTEAHANRFETVWTGRDERLTTLPVDSEFARELLDTLHTPSNRAKLAPNPSTEVVTALTSSPFLSLLNSSKAPLYPHQERVLRLACSRWPIRALLADEVGLGKTYEAAAVISFALQHAEVSRVVVLTPPTLLRQWQDEFHSSFSLDFWRYDSSARMYISPDGGTYETPLGPFKGDYPELVIVSRDLARGTHRTGHAFQGAALLPHMLVLDEAHTVRKSRTDTEARPSLVGRMVEELLEQVPHALFLTATPLQVKVSELYDALELLGLPSSFDESDYLHSLDLLSVPTTSVPELDQAASAIKMIRSLGAAYNLKRITLPAEVTRLLSDSPGERGLKAAIMAQGSWTSLREALVRVHPAATLCIRNTRETLSRVGYKFPARNFRAVQCAPSIDVGILLSRLDEYLTMNLGRVEAELYPGKQTAVGFVRSVYRQRAASTLNAIQVSLQRRLERLKGLPERLASEGDFGEEDVLDEQASLPSAQAEGVDVAALNRACAIESVDLEVLLSMFDRLRPSVDQADPKLDSALEAVRQFSSEGKSVLLFSRYTDSVHILISRYVAESGPGCSYAAYTGDGGFLSVNGREQKGDKALVTEALAEGAVAVVFCSDAASEGLNLQAASALINVDVPWNPARLEQRIGRIARLGQTAGSVDIVNLWYPLSVEAKIYERVLHRKDLMDLALGAFPEIVGSAIKSAVTGPSPNGIDSDVIQQLNEKRNELELEALTTLWSALSTDAQSVGSANLRSEITNALEDIWTSFGSALGGQREHSWAPPKVDALVGPMFTLHSHWMAWLASVPVSVLPISLRGRLGVLKRGSKPLTFALKEGPWVRALAPASIPDVLRAVYLGTQPDLHEHVFLEFLEGDSLPLEDPALTPWWPEPEAMTVPVKNWDNMPAVPDWAHSDSPVTFEPLLN